jgi:hypothetical protein
MKRRCMMAYVPVLKLLDGAPLMTLIGVYDQEDCSAWWMTMVPLDYLLDGTRNTGNFRELRPGVTMAMEVSLRPFSGDEEDGPRLLLRRDPDAPFYTFLRDRYVLFGLEGPDLRALTGSDLHTQMLPGDTREVLLSIRLKWPLIHGQTGGRKP